MLHINELSKQMNGFSLHNISLHLPKGYLMGLIGINGAGKSSLIKTILHMYTPDSGNITVNGYSMNTNELQAKNCIGTILDENFFELNLTAKANADYYGSYFQHYSSSEFLGFCKQFDLDPKKKLKQYSKGMLMKFQLAFALSHKPSLLLLDEPTASLDPHFRKELLSILTDFISDGEHSVLLSTHLTDDLDRVADYVTFINFGRIVFSSSCEDLRTQYALVTGEESLLNQIPKELVIWTEKTPIHCTSLIQKKHNLVFKDHVQITQPSIDELMYYMKKGGYADAATRV